MSEIQPSLGELEDAQNTAYENFFTARDAVTAAGERVAAADEAVCLAEKKYMNGVSESSRGTIFGENVFVDSDAPGSGAMQDVL